MTGKYTIKKSFEFCAAHRLHQLPDEHKCSKVHGHNYIVTVMLGSNNLDKDGFVIDFGKLKSFKEYLDKEWDHVLIVSEEDNELKSCIAVCPSIFKIKYVNYIPSAENMAKDFINKLKELYPQFNFYKVHVEETKNNIATYKEIS